jgi:hypothetical protein
MQGRLAGQGSLAGEPQRLVNLGGEAYAKREVHPLLLSIVACGQNRIKMRRCRILNPRSGGNVVTEKATTAQFTTNGNLLEILFAD